MPAVSRGPKIVYLAGVSFSGTTILGNVLGQLDGFFFGGELHNVWIDGLLENRWCSCGRSFRNCPVWRGTVEAADVRLEEIDLRALGRVLAEEARTRRVAAAIVGGADSRRLERFGPSAAAVYSALSDVTSSRVIVDSSKSPLYGAFLERNRVGDLWVIHVVRDPRATAYSGQRKGRRTRRELVRSALWWDATHAATERLWKGSPRYLRVRYEDFAEDPRRVTAEIVRCLGEPVARLPFAGDRAVTLNPGHIIAGNEHGAQPGVTTITPDMTWRTKMRRADRLLATMATAALLSRYGYPLRLNSAG